MQNRGMTLIYACKQTASHLRFLLGQSLSLFPDRSWLLLATDGLPLKNRVSRNDSSFCSVCTVAPLLGNSYALCHNHTVRILFRFSIPRFGGLLGLPFAFIWALPTIPWRTFFLTQGIHGWVFVAAELFQTAEVCFVISTDFDGLFTGQRICLIQAFLTHFGMYTTKNDHVSNLTFFFLIATILNVCNKRVEALIVSLMSFVKFQSSHYVIFSWRAIFFEFLQHDLQVRHIFGFCERESSNTSNPLSPTHSFR